MATKKKAAKKKAAYKPLNPTFFKQVTVSELDWSKVPVGTKVTAKVDRTIITGRIYKEDKEILICHNNRNKDCYTEGLLGYKYSVNIGTGSPVDLKHNEVQILELERDPNWVAPVQIFIDGDAIIFGKGKIRVGCTTVKNEVVREIAKNLVD